MIDAKERKPVSEMTAGEQILTLIAFSTFTDMIMEPDFKEGLETLSTPERLLFNALIDGCKKACQEFEEVIADNELGVMGTSKKEILEILNNLKIAIEKFEDNQKV